MRTELSRVQSNRSYPFVDKTSVLPSAEMISVVDATDADVVAWEPIWLDGAVVGWCTSGGYSHWTGKSVAQGFIPADRVQDGLALEVEILGERRPARVHLAPLWDDGGRMRG